MIKKNALRDRILQNTTLLSTDVLSESEVLNKRETVSTTVPFINVALSGDPEGGLQSGLLQIAGESKHFKTAFGLLMVSAFLNKYDDGVVIFYDSEFGTNKAYFELMKIDRNRIVHAPVTNIEELKHDIVKQIKDITKDDKVMIFVDSIGNLASLKEVSDAEEGKTVGDMTRAKQIKSVFRIITPHLTLKGIPMVVVNHVYDSLGMFSVKIVSGGQGAYLASNDIWIVGRQQEKDDKELIGFNFVINVEKSRTVKEKSKIPIRVSFENGVYLYSGVFDNALEAGIITNPSKGWYEYRGVKARRSEVENDTNMNQIVNEKVFRDFIRKKYALNA